MRFGDRMVVHSCALAEGSRELQQRVWSAEVGVVLPRIEELRQQLIDRYSSRFRMPYRTRFNQIIDDVRDLEIGHVCDQLQTISAPREDRYAAAQLTKMRNRLAHLETLDEPSIRGFRTVAAAAQR